MLIEDKIKLKDLKEELKSNQLLLDKLINLIYLQASEIDILQFKVLLKLEHKLDRAKELLNISKNIDLETKELLKKELETYEEKEAIQLLKED